MTRRSIGASQSCSRRDRLAVPVPASLIAVQADRPAPGEELNTGSETPARLAASVIVLRDGDGDFDVLLVQRNPEARFMGGAWVFPGGAAANGEDPVDTSVRECEEEASIRLSRDDLVPLSRWITPAQVKVRFDTFFYVVRAPGETEPAVDGEECVDWRWTTPARALDAYARGELQLVFPTIKHLELLSGLPTVDSVLAHAVATEVVPVQPRIVLGDGAPRVLLPGEPGFDD